MQHTHRGLTIRCPTTCYATTQGLPELGLHLLDLLAMGDLKRRNLICELAGEIIILRELQRRRGAVRCVGRLAAPRPSALSEWNLEGFRPGAFRCRKVSGSRVRVAAMPLCGPQGTL